ncbi:unnamed protein product [Allacma fusca]|uniref:Uncharacterized protein n=1 Tax=Allacma fusca TaxID=39272 RepID=A0A8J2K635_9HEXA|nr:unnamed protein product [Allacma fusca]
MMPAGIPVMAKVVAPLLAEPFGRSLMVALLYRRSFASKPTKTAEAVAPKKVKQIKPTKKKKTLSRVQMLHVENNLLFGKLMETKKDKITRIKKENGINSTSSDDSQAYAPVGKSTEDYSKEWELQRALQYHPDRVKVRYNIEDGNGSPSTSTDNTGTSTNDVISAFTPISSDTREDSKMNESNSQEESIIRVTSSVVPVSFPYLPNKDSKHKMPSVTRILGDTMPPEQRAVLERWEKKMREKLGDEGFRLYREGTF